MGVEQEFMEALQTLESAIVTVYRNNPTLTDREVINVLAGAINLYRAEARGHETKPPQLAGANETTLFETVRDTCNQQMSKKSAPSGGIMATNDIVSCLRKIHKSAERWNLRHGKQGYLQFVQEFVAQ